MDVPNEDEEEEEEEAGGAVRIGRDLLAPEVIVSY